MKRTKQEHIHHWTNQANDDWEAVYTLFNGKKYLQSLFFAHLVIEKLCKAVWIKHSDNNIPPRIHNLNYILSQTHVEVPEKISEFLLNLNRFQIEGRYPEYISKLHFICNKEFTENIIKQTEEVRKWLHRKLQ